MIINSQQDIDGLKEIGRVVALTIEEMKKAACVGMTTKELDELGGEVLRRYGAKSAPKVTYDFPGYTCISVNQEAAHGIPGDRKIQGGDVINVDVSAEMNGYYGDSGQSFQVPPFTTEAVNLCNFTYATMMNVISRLRAGSKVSEIGRIIEAEARRGGYTVIQNLCSHGIGKKLHEAPDQILPIFNPHDKRKLKEGAVLTVEPFLSTGAEYVVEQPDGWTLTVPGQQLVAQFEHTIIITKDEPIILTTV